VLTAADHQTFHSLAETVGLAPGDYWVKTAAHDDVTEWLSAADCGMALIRSAGCERGSSPIKIGEYLAAGLPVVATDGIGDYSELIRSKGLGVIIKSLDCDCYSSCIKSLTQLWADVDATRLRCRSAAERFLSLDDVGQMRYHQVYHRLLEPGLCVPEAEQQIDTLPQGRT
jgi:hypothetical protein